MRRAVAGGVGPGGRLPQLGAQFLFTWGNVSGESPRYEISGNMTEGNTMGVEREEYVEVVQDYSYQRDDRTFHMTKGEILMLLKRSTSDWWQVIRQGEQRPFFAPVQYVHITTVPQEQMKQFIKQGRQQQKLHQKQSSDEIIPVNRPQGLSLQQMESLSASANVEIPFTINPVTSHSYMATIEPTGVVSERRDQFPNRPHGFSSFKNDSLKGLSPRNSSSSSNELLSPNSRGPAHGGQESSSSHTSKSSLNDGSMESLKYLHSRKQGIKAASHDELICGNRSQSTLDVSQPRAASNEELDGHYSGRDYIFKSNQLSYRHRSNSVDFRLFQKELSFSEMKQGSLDKSRKPRLSKDPGNRRRSWAVEELRASENFRPSLRRGETVDAAIVLDVPPKLPPKQRKQRLETFNSSSENIGILEGPIDIKLQEVKLSMAPSGINVNSQSHSREMGHYRHTSDPLILSENEHKNSLSRHDAQDLKDPPVALPRKILPPQVSSLERNKEDEESTKSMKVGISASVSLGDSLPRETNSSQVKKSSSHSNLSSNPASKGGGILKRGASLSKGNHGPKICTNPDSVPKIPGTIDLLRIDGGTPTSTRKDYGPPESPRKHHISSGKVAGIIETWRSFKYKGERRDCKKEDEKENEGGIMSSRETPTPDTSRGGKMTQTPPSPQTSPQRIVFDDWGEYIDEGTKRQYFYNTRTREKRWKPPRKGIHSVAIPEVPPSARQEEPRCGSSRPPRSPAPDYPNSPKSSHKPFSYSNLPEGYLPSQLNRAATLTPASSVTSHPQLVSSLTLPAYGVSSHKNMSLHFPSNAHQIPALGSNTPPIAPPSSAKPHYPSTPTTEFPELPETESNSALLDILYNMSPPKGWRKEYDALTQMVYFYNTATKQRSKGVTWVTEVDISHHENKQYMRKSYQSTMDLAKELQLDADVFVNKCYDSGEASVRSTVTPACEGDNTINVTEKIQTQNHPEASKAPGHKQERDVGHDAKVPPKKPPRKSQLSVQASLPIQTRQTEVVAITSRPRSPRVQTRCVLGPLDTPSIMEPGSRVSSFAPRSSTSRPHGHSRSKSESLKVDQLKLQDIGIQDSALALSSMFTSLGPDSRCATTPRSQVTRTPSPKSPSPHATRSKSPSPLATRSKSPQKYSISPKSPSFMQKPKSPSFMRKQKNQVRGPVSTQQDTSSETLISKRDVSPGSIAEKCDKEISSHHPAGMLHCLTEQDQNEKCTESDNEKFMPKSQFDEILKELSAHSIMSALSHLLPSYNESSEEINSSTDSECVRIPYKTSESGVGKDEGTLRKRGQEGIFSFSISPQDRLMEGKTVPKSLSHVRKSTFISQDEVGFILEDKSLSSIYRSTSSEASSPILLARINDSVSSRSLSYDQGSEIQSDWDESTFTDDAESFSPTLQFHFTGSDGGRERKKSQDSQKIDDCDNSSVDGKGIRVSTIAENLAELSANIVKEGFLHRTFFLRDGKKVRKNWTQSYVRFIVGAFNSGSSGLLYFSKTKDEDKKAEIFEFYPTCYLEHTTDKKTSRQQVLGLRNGHDTEVLLQFEDKDIAVEWFKILETHEGVQYSVAPTLEKEEKKGKRGSEKIKREASVEHLNPDSKGITDKLRNFIKRRPLKETLEKKGIYKESVFGSTLAELHIQDKTTIPIFVLQCINHIEKNHENLHTDGLYRISGNAAQIQKIRFEVAQRNYSILSREKEIHNLSGALKLFFRELKEPLIPFDNYQDFIQATGSEYRRMNQQVEKLTKAVNRLPPENYDTLKVLLQHLLRVSEFESENRMSISNLAIVFGPCLLWPQVTSSHDLMTDVMLHNRVIEGLLSDFSQIFSSRK
ncbi:uncharacterized protein [Procambarus clarkii]|uniref:uncharacterized protein isoform X2 n=1 Tax=Procambarus clarkii TaxID=6728 RepID=UPI001E66FEDD|nr:uncharacterized protein LOC123747090 isoform X2 [Procambarus clarkii]